jgi:hypothetical protein
MNSRESERINAGKFSQLTRFTDHYHANCSIEHLRIPQTAFQTIIRFIYKVSQVRGNSGDPKMGRGANRCHSHGWWRLEKCGGYVVCICPSHLPTTIQVFHLLPATHIHNQIERECVCSRGLEPNIKYNYRIQQWSDISGDVCII